MKITFLVYNIYGMGGTVRTVANTANFLANQGYRVEIISVRKTRTTPMFELDKRIKLKPIFDARRGMLFGKNTPKSKKVIKTVLMKIPSILIDKNEELYHMFNLFVDLKIINAIRKIDEGVFITTIPSFNLLSPIFASKDLIKIGQEHKYYNGYHPRLQKKIKKYYRKLDSLICLTDSEIAVYKEILQGSNTKLFKIENATKMPNFSSDLNEKTIIAAGRYVYEKGFDMLINSFEIVINKHPDWKLKIFGAGEEEETLRNLIFSKKLYNNVFLMPKTNNILEEMSKSSIYALSSRQESFGMVVVEAMSVGVPCVSFACPGPAEIIKNNEDGIVVEKENINAFADALMYLIENEDIKKEMGKLARKNVRRYSFNSLGEKWIAMLNLFNKQDCTQEKSNEKII
ncbi:glycosyltransferase family 4 protein [Bacillus sp. Bos-x628]|uniref:glycosyltransferase family 4 protein n=1 Tax=Bacillus maqinnsis TaxID=3229854 RepID=UPI00338D80F1